MDGHEGLRVVHGLDVATRNNDGQAEKVAVGNIFSEGPQTEEVNELRGGAATARRPGEQPDNKLSLVVSEGSPKTNQGRFVGILNALADAWSAWNGSVDEGGDRANIVQRHFVEVGNGDQHVSPGLSVAPLESG